MTTRNFIYTRNSSTSSTTPTVGDWNAGDFIRIVEDSTPVTDVTELRTSSGIDAKLSIKRNKEEQGISAKLYFKFVKSKLTKIQQNKLEEKLKNLSQLIEYADDTHQLALYEECAKKILETIKEQEISLLGIDYFLTKNLIDKFINKVQGKVIRFKQLSEFPRIIPVNVRKKLKNLQEKNIFDEYWILYTDFTPKEDEIKSTKQKIIEKDPILFGRFNLMPDKYYFIADWVDEYCNLVFDKLVDKLNSLEQDFKLPMIETFNSKSVQKLKKEILERQEKLRSTNRSNFKDLASSENNKKKSLFKRLFKL